MAQLALAIAILALVAGVVALVRLGRIARGGIPTSQPPVEMPVVILLSDVASTTMCSRKEFHGEVELELLYLAMGRPNAEVRVRLEIRNRNNVTVSLASTDLGIFRNDVTKKVGFSGELTNPCAGGDFRVFAIVVNQGPGSTQIVEATRVDVDGLDFETSMPAQVSTTDGIRFRFDIDITCCGPGIAHTIDFANVADVQNLAAAPAGFTCAAAAGAHAITITGRKTDVNRVGTFTVKAVTAFGDCTLGSVQVE